MISSQHIFISCFGNKTIISSFSAYPLAIYIVFWYIIHYEHRKGLVIVKKNLFKITLTALFTALTTLATLVAIPGLSPHGYVNIGDTLVLMSSLLLGPVYGTFAAAVGSALADITLGYAIFAPCTLVIKGLMAVVFWLITKKIKFFAVNKKRNFVGYLLGGILAEIVMIVGYFFANVILFHDKFVAALASIPSDSLQAGISLALFIILATALNAVNFTDRINRFK